MRITIILGPFYPVPTVLGGAVEKVQLALASCYATAGHHVTVVSRQFGEFALRGTQEGVHHIRIPSFDRHGSLAMNLLLGFFYDLRAALAMPTSDITVTNSFFLPLVLYRRKAGKIYVHAARYPKGQFSLYRRADRIQAVSMAVANAVTAQAPRLAGKVVVIGNPLPDKYFAGQSNPAKESVILFVGRLAREKGLDLLIRAFAALVAQSECGSEWRLRIVGPHQPENGGDGEGYLGELKALAAPLGARCEFAGPIFDEDRLTREYVSAAIFAYPSIAERGESFGLSPLEAMASGCAVVVSALSCFDDFVTDGKNALKFDHRHPDAAGKLGEALAALVFDPELRGRLAASGAATAERFRLPLIAKKMLDDFDRLASGTDKGRSRR